MARCRALEATATPVLRPPPHRKGLDSDQTPRSSLGARQPPTKEVAELQRLVMERRELMTRQREFRGRASSAGLLARDGVGPSVRPSANGSGAVTTPRTAWPAAQHEDDVATGGSDHISPPSAVSADADHTTPADHAGSMRDAARAEVLALKVARKDAALSTRRWAAAAGRRS